MPLTRRDFLKISSAAVGATALASGLTSKIWGLDGDPVANPGTDGDTVVPTLCELCFWKCGVLAHVKHGHVTKIVGNPAHPLSLGHLCPRGTGGVGLLYDPDRLKKPLIRRGPRGSQHFEEVSWDEALDFTAKKLLEIKEKHGPEAVALFSHGFGGSFFKHLLNAYGSDNVGAPSYAQCRGGREVGFQLTFGAPVGSPETIDLENSRVITLIGSHLGENMHNTQVQEFATAISRGAQLVVVDPRFSTAAGKAKYWLPIKPGTDIALLLAWMHVIVQEKLYDRDYLEQYATGLEELTAYLLDKTPEWAAVETGIAPELIIETGRFIAGARPASLIHPGRHTAWYGDDAQRARAMAMLNALVGSYGRKGGFYLPTKLGVPKYPGVPAYAHKPKPAPDKPKGVAYPFADETLAHGLRDASFPGTAAYDIKGWIVYGTNLVQALPEPRKTIAAMEHLDFILAIDVLPAEITGYADVVFPEATYLERWDDVAVTPYKEPYIAIRQPVVAPMFDSKPGSWIAKELAKRMNLAEFFPWEDAGAMVKKRLEAGGFDVAKLKKVGVHVAPHKPVFIEEGLEPAFPTPSKKIELWSKQLADAGLDPLPKYTPPEEPPAGQFRLLMGRTPTHTFGRTTNNRFLSEVFSENELWLNAAIAQERGLQNGERVWLVNQDGAKSGPVRLKATQRIRTDCVFLVHGYGHKSNGLRFAKGRGADDAALMTRVRIDPLMGGTGMNVNFVQIEKVTA